MKKMIHKILRIIKSEIYEVEYIFLNYIVCYIPFWPLRKIIYVLLGMKIGKGSRLMMSTKIYMPHKIRIGNYTYINENCYLDGRGGLKIGSNVTIATYSKLITGSHNIDDNFFSYCSAPIIIEDNVSIFSDTLVLGGALLKKGVVISAKSLVRKGEYKEYGIYAGNPAAYVRNRNSSCEYVQEKMYLLFR